MYQELLEEEKQLKNYTKYKNIINNQIMLILIITFQDTQNTHEVIKSFTRDRLKMITILSSSSMQMLSQLF